MRHIIDEKWDRGMGSGYVIGTRCALHDCSCQTPTALPLLPLTRNLFLKKKKKKKKKKRKSNPVSVCANTASACEQLYSNGNVKQVCAALYKF